MDFLKNHYEKVLLSIVLLGLAVAAGLLPMRVSKERAYLQTTIQDRTLARTNEFPQIELTEEKGKIARLQSTTDFHFSGTHNVFNPVPWRRSREGTWDKLQRGNEFGPGALQIIGVRPLHLVVQFHNIGGSADNPNFQISVLRETEPRPRPQMRFSKLGTKNDLFKLTAIRPADDPKEFDVQLEGETAFVTVRRDEPYTRIIGYAVDLKYPPENQLIPDKRRGDKIRLAGDPDTYTLVSISTNQVVVEAESTQKRQPVRAGAAP